MYYRHTMKENVRQGFYNNKKTDLQYERHRSLLAFKNSGI